MAGFRSLMSVSTENPSRTRSAKPEWEKAQARFIKSLGMEKEGESSAITSSHIASSLSVPPFGSHRITEEGDKVFFFGSDIAGSPDNFVCRQRFLRSYVFTREEEKDTSKNHKESLLQKAKSWFEVKRKAKDESGIANPCSCSDTWLRFWFCFIAKFKVQTKRLLRSMKGVSIRHD